MLGSQSYLSVRGYVFLFGHMRSYSSLLSHLLGSHPDIAGYAEMHQKYRNVLDLVELAEKVEKSSDKSPVHRLVLDKILHPLTVKDSVLLRKNLSVILIARRPDNALASIMALNAGGIAITERAVEYYVSRLEMLEGVLHRRRGRALYVDAEAIIEKTSTTLSALSSYLRLKPPLAESYAIFRHTGAPKFGDPSERIKKGTIVRAAQVYPPLHLGATQRARVESAYHRLRERAARYAEAKIFCDPQASIAPPGPMLPFLQRNVASTGVASRSAPRVILPASAVTDQ